MSSHTEALGKGAAEAGVNGCEGTVVNNHVVVENGKDHSEPEAPRGLFQADRPSDSEVADCQLPDSFETCPSSLLSSCGAAAAPASAKPCNGGGYPTVAQEPRKSQLPPMPVADLNDYEEPDDEEGLGGSGNDPAEQVWLDDAATRSQLLDHMNALRRSGKFCDVTLRVNERVETAAHKSVLAAASPFFDAAFAGTTVENGSGAVANNEVPKTRRQRTTSVLAVDGIDIDAFDLLLDYAYTGRLCLRPALVKAVYQGAIKLQMRQVMEVCGQHLWDQLDAVNCLDTHLLAVRSHDNQLIERTEHFIQSNFGTVKTSREFMALPRLQVKIYGAESERLAASDSRPVCQLVTDWLAMTLESRGAGSGNDLDLALDHLCSHEHLLYLTVDNHLRDCAGIDDDTDLGRNDCIIDYKKMARRQHTWNLKEATGLDPTKHNTLGVPSRVIASEQDPPSSFSYVCLSVVSGERLVAASLHFSVPAPAAPPALEDCERRFMDCGLTPLSPGSSSSSGDESGSGVARRGSDKRAAIRPSSFVPLATMSAARCGVGLAVLPDGVLAAVGGHDRGECLDTVEAFNCGANYWLPMPPMNSRRGRFECEQIKGRLYACGGSDGRRELDSAECFDPHSGRWTMLAEPMAERKSNAGVGVVRDCLYVVGGWSGQSAERSCEMYDPSAGTWQIVAPLNIGRSQAAVCSFDDKLYAFGGQDSWSCFSSAEVYDSRANKWQLLSAMPCCRRGAGVAMYRGKIYLVGGSDGSVALRTTHIYDPLEDAWCDGPALITKRVNVGVAVGSGQLYAVGGFSGKEFLNTIERLDVDDNSEWCSYACSSRSIADEPVDK